MTKTISIQTRQLFNKILDLDLKSKETTGYFDSVCERVFYKKLKELGLYSVEDDRHIELASALYIAILEARYSGSNGRWDRGNVSINTQTEKELMNFDFNYIF